MSASLNNVPSSDEWRELSAPKTARLRILVANAAILYEVARSDGGPPWYGDDPATLLPGLYSLDTVCDAVRFKSLARATPARVSLQALTAEELGDG